MLGTDCNIITVAQDANLLNYKPLVGDSVTYDTPILVKDKYGEIDIIPICDIFDESQKVEFDNEQYRDFSKKDYQVLTRNGWVDIKYVYKHKTDKELRRIETKNGIVDCTIDHSLFNDKKEEVKPTDLVRGSKIELYEGNIDYKKSEILTADEAWLYGFFMADGSSCYSDRKYKRFSKKNNDYIEGITKRANWKISNKSLERLSRAEKIIENSFNEKCDIKNHLKSSNVYNLTIHTADIAKKFSKEFYTSYRYKKVPKCILNGSKEIKKSFLDGFCCGDGQGDTMNDCTEFGQKSKVAMAGLYFILKELKYNFRSHIRNDKPEFLAFRFKNHRGNLLDEHYSNRRENEVWSNRVVTSKSDYVYDISADGTFVNPLGMNILHNTDGFNFQMPEKFRYTKENPYISKGLGRNYPKGEAFYDVDADVAEFEDLFLNESYAVGPNKMGLGIDEYVPASINFARKNYADLLDAETGKIKLVGNTIKSKKMPIYIEKFLDKAIKMLLYGQGKEFLDYYYDYLDDIYNLRIPLKDIASVGKIKKSIEEYKSDCMTYTAAGTKKPRQAWYELVIQEGLNVNMGDAIYYINIGKKKGDSDVQRVTKFYVENVDKTKEFEKEYNKVKKETNPKDKAVRVYNGRSVNWIMDEKGKWKCMKLSEFIKKYYPYAIEQDELIFNCVLVPTNIVEDEEDHFCDENFEYNVTKYVEQFNKRIRPLLVCFSRDIRTKIDPKTGKEIDNILVNNPADRKEFTAEEAKLTSGEPYKETDQDTYDALMTMEDKEIKFWLSQNKKPIFADEIGMNWEKMVADYNKRLEEMKTKEATDAAKKLDDIFKKMKKQDILEGEFPDTVLGIVDYEPNSGMFVTKDGRISVMSYNDIIDTYVGEINEENDEDSEE